MGLFILSTTEDGTQSTLGAFADAVLARKESTADAAPVTAMAAAPAIGPK